MAGQITAIVPTFNRSAFLAETLEALVSQTRPLHQIIVWDDGSSDGTPDTVAGLQARHPGQILYKRAENGGKSRALNHAMTLADGDYIWVCDDDDVSLPDAAERLADGLDRSDVGLVAGRHLRFSNAPDTGNREVSDTGYWPDLTQGSLLRHTLEDIFFFQNATLVRRNCYAQVGPFRADLKRSIDYDMTVRLLARFPAALAQGTVFLQRKHDGARGPAGARHAASQSESVWLAADRAIFADLRRTLPLSLYEAMFSSADPDLRRRAGLLQRAVVYARRCDWDRALDDFEAAAAICPDRPLCATEQGIVRRAMAAKHGPGTVFSPDTRRRMIHASRSSKAGRHIMGVLSRGAVWRLRAALRDRRLRDAGAISGFVARLPPALGRAPAVGDTEMTELTDLPREAYQW